MNTTTETRVPSPEQEYVVSDDLTTVSVAPKDNVPATRRESEQLPEGAERRPDAEPELPHKVLQGYDKITAAIAGVMAEIKGVEKGGKNEFHGYKYARMQDILTTLTPLIGKHGLVIFQTEHHRSLFDSGNVIAIQYRFTIAHASGQVWPEHPLQTGMSFCRDKNGKFDDKALNKCHTAGRKYFLLAMFQVPTEDENDADNEKQRRVDAPVPGPTGHVPPYYIEPVKGETPKSWAAKYRATIKHSKTAAELVEWDNVNDALLSSLQEKAPDLYGEVMKEFSALEQHLALGAAPKPAKNEPVPGPTKSDPISTGRQQTKPVRPAGCPDADKEPDAFMEWANKRLREVAERKNPTELTLIWESEITPASDGLFKPDCDALQQTYDELLARIGG